MWIRNYKHSEDLVRWWLFFPKALAFVISTPFVFRKGYFQMVLPSFVTLPFHPPPPPPFETPFKFLRRLRVFKCYYVWCRFCIQYLCQRHEEWQDLFRFCFHCCKDLHHFFFWGNRWPSYVCDYIGNNVHSFFVWSPTQNIFAYISSIPK